MSDSGRSNEIFGLTEQDHPKSLRFFGNSNVIEIGSGGLLSSLSITIRGDENRLIIENGCELRGDITIKGLRCIVLVGARTTAAGVRINAGDGRKIIIGQDCMFSRNVEIRCWDEHPIYDKFTKLQINNGRDVVPVLMYG